MAESRSIFADLPLLPKDAIFALTAEYQKDPFPRKVNLGQGTYRDDSGLPWILPCVAESRRILTKAGLLHEYLPILGLAEFREAACEMVLGKEIFENFQNQIASCQSLSGTGALHLAGLLLRRVKQNCLDVYITEPTWSNHHQVFSSLGFNCHRFNYYDPVSKTVDMKSYRSMLETAPRGSIVILHACAHNPTGCDPTKDEWREVGSIMKERELFPLFDAAYLGFNSGSIDQDAFAVRHFVDDLKLEVAVCMSFAKNMGLYGERVGCTMIVTNSKDDALRTESVLEILQRSEVSNPPAYGAKIASTILRNERLRKMWYQDLITMSGRIMDMRQSLHDKLIEIGAPGKWDHLIQQSGMFGFLGLSPEVVNDLKERYHVYMASNSRVSIAGLNRGNVDYVAYSIAESLKSQKRTSGGYEQARI